MPKARLAPVKPFWVRHKDVVQFGYTPGCKGCQAARAGARQQAPDEMCRTRTLNELMKTAEGKERIVTDGGMKQDNRARVEMDASDSQD